MGVRNKSSHLSRGKIAAIVMAVVIGIALIAAGVGFGVHVHAVNVARAREAQAVAAAQADCRKSISALQDAKTAFTTASNTKNVTTASKITASQVEDKRTVDRLKDLLSDNTTYASCTISSRSKLLAAAKANKIAAKTVTAHTTGLATAAEAVTASKKRLDDQEAKAKAAAEKKAQAEAKRKAALAAQTARAQAQARKSGAPHRMYRYQTRHTYTPRRTNHYYNHSNYQAPQYRKGDRNNGGNDNKPPTKPTNNDNDWRYYKDGYHVFDVYGSDF